MDYLKIACDLLSRAKKSGAADAEVYIEERKRFSVDVLKDKIENIIESSGAGLGLRVFLEGRTAFVHTTDFSSDLLADFVRESISLARVTKKDESIELTSHSPGEDDDRLDIFDSEIANLSPDTGIELVKGTAEAAISTAKFKTDTVTAHFFASSGKINLINSLGFQKSFSRTESSLGCCVVSHKNGEKHRGCFHSRQRFLNKLPSPNLIGKKALYKAERILGARKIKSGKMPVILEGEVAACLWENIFQALKGNEVFHRRSFLADMAGMQVASPLVTLRDNGRLRAGTGTVPWDAEGIPSQDKIVINKGILTEFLYDTVYAKKVNKSATGNTRRAYNTLPELSPTNLYLEKGSYSPAKLVASLKEGLCVSFLFGMGVDPVTGSFSQGAEGIYIENGEPAFPVAEVVISGNMLEMLKGIEKIGADLEFHHNISSPGIIIQEMTVGGM